MRPSADHVRSGGPSRRGFLAAGLSAGLAAPCLSAAAAGSREEDSFDLNELSISALQAGITAGKYTARSLAERYLARIEVIDRQGPTLRRVIEVNPDALALAEELDKEYKKTGPRGPLHGSPAE